MTKISIVVPIFHAHARITEALESIRLQTHPLDKLETIIVCDASNDLCVRMVREFLQQHGMQGTVLAMDGNYGAPVPMLNRGWQTASGDWIQFLDSDDILAPNKFEMQISQTSRRCDVICSSWQRLCLSAGTWQPVGGVKTPKFTEPVILKIVSLQSSVLGPALFFRKSLEAVAGILLHGQPSHQRASDAQALEQRRKVCRGAFSLTFVLRSRDGHRQGKPT